MAVPHSVLSEQLSEAIGDRTVQTAVFTTFNFDPGFFEVHILPLLFPSHKFSEAEKIRLIQLEDCLRTIENLAVYYDANALALDGDTPKLGYGRVGVHWKRGVFHPKLIFLLVDEPEHKGIQSLIVCCQSANITRAGWWENVECAHIEEVVDKRLAAEPCSFRNDLMSMLIRIRRFLPHENHDALDTIHHFIRHRTDPVGDEEKQRAGNWAPRLFGGSPQLSFSEWLTGEAQIPPDWNLEVISPYFDKHNANALEAVVESTKPRQTRVYLPQSDDGTVLVSEEVYNQVEIMRRVQWALFPSGMVQRQGAGTVEKLAPRFVHAKVYRFWKRGHPNLIVVGSVNCTSPAHSKADKGNLEAGFLVDGSKQKLSREWWLEPRDVQLTQFVDEIPDEADGNDRALFNVVVRYDWARHDVAVHLDGNLRFPVSFTDLSDKPLFQLDSYDQVDWQLGDQSAANQVQNAIKKSSFINVQCDGVSWRILLREESFSHRPSLLDDLTPEEILKYWSLLSPEQRTAFLESRMADSIEGLASSSAQLIDTTESVFHQFSGIFHAFGHLRRYLRDCLDNERAVEAEYRFFGSKYDSMPELLRKMIDKKSVDSLFVYIMFLTARQLRDWVVAEYEYFLEGRAAMLSELDRLIAKGLQSRDEILLKEDIDPDQFFMWYESMFLKDFRT